jgi:hypothetical protein
LKGAGFDVPLEILCGSWLQPRHKKSANDLLPFGGLSAEPCFPACEKSEKLTASASLLSFSQLPIIVAMKICFTTDAQQGGEHSRPQHSSARDPHFASAGKGVLPCRSFA